MDIVGPIHPVTDKGNRYILTLVGFATRYPEAIPMHSFETERVAGALIDIFSRVEVPVELLSDMGSEFTSSIMREVSRFLSLNQLTTTPYHPMTNGMVERFNGTLKQMLKLCVLIVHVIGISISIQYCLLTEKFHKNLYVFHLSILFTVDM